MLRPLVVMIALALASAGAAQQLQQGLPQSPVLTIEPERLFSESGFGKRVAAELEAEGARIAAENREIEASLIDEERALTERRAELPPDEFRTLADAFDEKVQRLRREQDTKARALGAKSDELRRRFLNAAQPVLAQMMRDAGAAVIIERRAIFLSADVIDITDEAIARIDVSIGDGQALMTPEVTAPPAEETENPDTLPGAGAVDNDASGQD